MGNASKKGHLDTSIHGRQGVQARKCNEESPELSHPDRRGREREHMTRVFANLVSENDPAFFRDHCTSHGVRYGKVPGSGLSRLISLPKVPDDREYVFVDRKNNEPNA